MAGHRRGMQQNPATGRHPVSASKVGNAVGGRLLAINEVAERMSVTPRFVRRLIAERRIRYYKLGRHVRLAQDDVDEWVRQRSVEPSRQ